jgi:hypothetical protein
MADEGKKTKTVSGVICNTDIEPSIPDYNNVASEDLLQFDNLTSELSAVLVNAPEENLENELNSLLKKFVEFLEVDRGVVVEYLDGHNVATVLMQHTIPGIDVPPLSESYSLEK